MSEQNTPLKQHIIDLTALRAGAKDIETRIRALKQSLRSPWERPMCAEQDELRHLKREITTHYVLRALLRGRRHPDHVPERVLQIHLELAEKLAVKYRRQAPPEEVAADEIVSRARPSLIRQLWGRITGASAHVVG